MAFRLNPDLMPYYHSIFLLHDERLILNYALIKCATWKWFAHGMTRPALCSCHGRTFNIEGEKGNITGRGHYDILNYLSDHSTF